MFDLSLILVSSFDFDSSIRQAQLSLEVVLFLGDVYLVHFNLWFGVIKDIPHSEFTLFTIEGPSRIGSSKASLQPGVVSALFVETNEANLLRLELPAQVASSRGEEKLGPLSGLSSQEFGTIIRVQPSRLRGHQISFNIVIIGADINWILRGALSLRCSFKDLRITRTHSLSNYIAFRSSTLRHSVCSGLLGYEGLVSIVKPSSWYTGPV